MRAIEKDTQMRVHIMDSLVARSGKVLSPDIIRELTEEILERMIDIHEVPLAQWENEDVPQ